MSKDKKKKKRNKWTLKMQTGKASTASIGTPWQVQLHPTATLEFTHNGTRYRGTVYPVENAE